MWKTSNDFYLHYSCLVITQKALCSQDHHSDPFHPSPDLPPAFFFFNRTRLLEGPERTLIMDSWQKPTCFDPIRHHSPNQPLNHLHNVVDGSWAGPERMGLWQTSFSWSVISVLNARLRLLAGSWLNQQGLHCISCPKWRCSNTE